MAKLYLLGGENTIKRTAREINHAAFIDAGGSPDVLVFTWARASFDNIYARRRRIRGYFQSLGAKSVKFVDYSESLEEISAQMTQSTLIYLTGGQLTILITRLKAKGVDDLLRDFSGVIVGRSAGALALAKQGVVTERYSQKVKLMPGLGLANLYLKTHYKPAKDEALKRLSVTQKIYAIPSASALIWKDNKASFFGKCFLFEKGEKRKLQQLLF